MFEPLVSWTLTGTRPLSMKLTLGIGIRGLWMCETNFGDIAGASNPHHILSQILLASTADARLIDEVDLVAFVNELRSESLSVVWCIKPSL